MTGMNSKFVEVSVAIDSEQSSANINVYLENPQQNSPHLYLDDGLIRTPDKKLNPLVAYQLFSLDYKAAIQMKFPRDSSRKILERIKQAWRNAPQQVHQGYFELEKKVFNRFANKYPTLIVPNMKPTSEDPGADESVNEG